MNVELAVLDLTSRGVQVTLGEGEPFWLPRTAPGLSWSAPPEIGDVVVVRLPEWLCAKHRQIQALRYQQSLAFHQPSGFDPERAAREGSLPMANDRPQDAGSGSLKRNAKKERPSQPDYVGSASIRGRKFYLSGWINTNEDDGSKWLKIAIRDAEERTEQRQQPQPPADRDTIPF